MGQFSYSFTCPSSREGRRGCLGRRGPARSCLLGGGESCTFGGSRATAPVPPNDAPDKDCGKQRGGMDWGKGTRNKEDEVVEGRDVGMDEGSKDKGRSVGGKEDVRGERRNRCGQ